MSTAIVPLVLFVLAATGLAVGLLTAAWLLGPKRQGLTKQMPYESGMDPIHDTRRRFDVRFHLVAIVFLLFDVELLFLYPWAVASRDARGFSLLASQSDRFSRPLVFAEVMVFVGLLTLGLVYVWRKGVFRWR
ncbi:MAG: NADH-quinone oxidoreductase subunit A [Planctomycetes bacterium]|nr:NADH-quinone oxidoreductase subunit A [Planctomycetota bacterium]